MDVDLEVIDGKTYTRPGSDLRRAEVRHMLNGFVTKLDNDPDATLATTLDTLIPRHLAERLIASRDLLRKNYRITTVGTSPMLLGRPIRKDA